MNQKNNFNLLKKIFPFDNCKDLVNLKFDTEGLWSISYPNDANKISEGIKIFEKTGIKINTIFDMTAGLGGNTISFCKYFDNVIASEIDHERFKILENNMKNYNYQNYELLIGDSIAQLSTLKKEIDAVFIDPPWGGPNYKYDTNINITLSGLELHEIVKIVTNYKYNESKIKVLSLKLPYNFDFKSFYQKIKFFMKAKKKVLRNNVVYLHILLN